MPSPVYGTPMNDGGVPGKWGPTPGQHYQVGPAQTYGNSAGVPLPVGGAQAGVMANLFGSVYPAYQVANSLSCPANALDNAVRGFLTSHLPSGVSNLLGNLPLAPVALDNWLNSYYNHQCAHPSNGPSPIAGPAVGAVATIDPDIGADLDEILAQLGTITSTMATSSQVAPIATQVADLQDVVNDIGAGAFTLAFRTPAWGGVTLGDAPAEIAEAFGSGPGEDSRNPGESTVAMLTRLMPAGLTFAPYQVGWRNGQPINAVYVSGYMGNPPVLANFRTGWYLGEVFSDPQLNNVGVGSVLDNPMFACSEALAAADVATLNNFSCVGVTLGGLLAALQAAMAAWDWIGGTSGHYAHGVAPNSSGAVVWCTVLDWEVDQMRNTGYVPTSGLPARSVKGDTASLLAMIPFTPGTTPP